LNGKVVFATDVIGADANKKRDNLKDGEAVLIENLRFHWEEEKKDEAFCKALAYNAEIYVNDAFGTAHRSHAYTAAIVEYGIIKTAVCGFLIEKELAQIPSEKVRGIVVENLEKIGQGSRDFRF